ncbi:MAG: hypothetical protein BroJett025_10630 [Patescibacteria group bacterium]|nr:MAG: hypothetical protein BroJett025_10630 [Patescibacteria group bacterium]
MKKKLEQKPELLRVYYKIGLLSLSFGVLGARLWHIVTDFQLYSHNFYAMLELRNGGLSILGGVIGGVIGMVVSFFIFDELKQKSFSEKRRLFFYLLDSLVFGLPVGQAIGRLGNYFNQELYGSPTTGIVKIFIDTAHRLPGYEQFAYYHPLFLYEMTATGFFAVCLYILHKKKTSLLPKTGTGKLFVLYVLYYSTVRFFLDFLRIDEEDISLGILGVNQVVLLLLIIAILLLTSLKKKGKYV